MFDSSWKSIPFNHPDSLNFYSNVKGLGDYLLFLLEEGNHSVWINPNGECLSLDTIYASVEKTELLVLSYGHMLYTEQDWNHTYVSLEGSSLGLTSSFPSAELHKDNESTHVEYQAKFLKRVSKSNQAKLSYHQITETELMKMADVYLSKFDYQLSKAVEVAKLYRPTELLYFGYYVGTELAAISIMQKVDSDLILHASVGNDNYKPYCLYQYRTCHAMSMLRELDLTRVRAGLALDHKGVFSLNPIPCVGRLC